MMNNIVFFDGECNFCNSTVDFIWNRNKKRNLYYASLQSDFASKFLKENGIEDIKLDTIYFFSGGKVFSKTKAFVMILKELNCHYKAFAGALNILPSPFSNKVYDMVAKNRHSIFGDKDSCRIPTKEEQEYFIV